MTLSAKYGCEEIINLSDHSKILTGFISIHNTNLGPALGGTRVYPYRSRQDALLDAVDLSKAMTYKCAISGMPFGGGKGVIVSKSEITNFKEILREYSLVVEKLKGRFYTGEDVGLNEENVQYMLKFSDYFVGRTGKAGDPSKYAALSAYECLTVACKHKGLRLSGSSVVIKGLGKTGSVLLEKLSRDTKKIYVSDTNMIAVKRIRNLYPFVKVVAPNNVTKLNVDIFAPCALGNELNATNVKSIKFKIICGTANNQLADSLIAQLLAKRKILYIPDFVANAGGLLNVGDELLKGGYKKSRVLANITKLKKTLNKILVESDLKKESPNSIAIRLAERRFL